MADYNWRGISANGQMTEGRLHQTDRVRVIADLKAQGITPLRISRIFSHPFAIFHNKNKIITLRLTRQLALLLQAHISIDHALMILQQSEKKQHIKNIIDSLRKSLSHGENLSIAMAEWPQYFSSSYCVFIAAAEASGDFVPVFQHLLAILENKHQLQLQIKKALSYPLFLLVCTVLISVGILFFIIPTYGDFFSNMGGSLPPLTTHILNISQWLQYHAAWCAGMLFAAIFYIMFAFKKPSVRSVIDRYLLYIPVVRRILIHRDMTDWSHILALSLRAKITLLTALSMANAVIKNHYLKSQFDRLPRDIEMGKSFYEGLTHHTQIDSTTLQLVLIGENSGTLSTVLTSVAASYAVILSEDLNRLARYAEPLAIIFLAGFTGMIVTALYLPMINLGLNI